MEKDANLALADCNFKGTKKVGSAVACRSETAKGTKDPVETILVLLDLHILAGEPTAGGALQPYLLIRVLGIEHEEEAIFNCGGVKEKAKGILGCSLTPGLKELESRRSLRNQL